MIPKVLFRKKNSKKIKKNNCKKIKKNIKPKRMGCRGNIGFPTKELILGYYL